MEGGTKLSRYGLVSLPCVLKAEKECVKFKLFIPHGSCYWMDRTQKTGSWEREVNVL